MPHGPETYEDFLTRAAVEANPAAGSPARSLQHMPKTQPLTARQKRVHRVIWYGALITSQAAVGSLIAAIVFLVQDIKGFGPTAGHIVWMVLSANFSLMLSGLVLLLWVRRRQRAKAVARAEAIELENHAARAEVERRDNEIKARALERAARRSLHSVEEAERDVRVLSELLEQVGVTDPLGAGEGEDVEFWDGDDVPMTAEERAERRAARRELLEKRKIERMERQLAVARAQQALRQKKRQLSQRDGRPAQSTGDKAERGRLMEDEQMRLANRARVSRSRENVGSWIERQSQVRPGPEEGMAVHETQPDVGRQGGEKMKKGSKWRKVLNKVKVRGKGEKNDRKGKGKASESA
ncbi:MAG: hypothetical protein M1832_002703 [Thelocarpon impressellum]|nr:MAG: hypothetical protein M1832_002703 [Thelocarpon impressellum]